MYKTIRASHSRRHIRSWSRPWELQT